jgi:beta-galactosidase
MAGFTRRKLIKTSAAAAALSQTPLAWAGDEPGAEPSGRYLLDFGWRFHLGHADDPVRDFGFGASQDTFAKSGANVAGAAAPDFDDGDWTAIDLPHDWAVELPFTPGLSPPATGDDPCAEHGFRPLGRDYPATSIGWYRRSFEIPASDRGGHLALEFDGVFRNCIVMLNGFVVGANLSGYAPFRVDIADFVNYGGSNVLTLRVDATLGEGWFYEGAGIYRHVWLVKSEPVHIPQWGIWARSEVVGGHAAVSVACEVSNAGDAPAYCAVAWTILDPAGRAVARPNAPKLQVAPGQTRDFESRAVLDHPLLWSLEEPQLYRLVAEVSSGGRIVDRRETAFGIRTIRFDPAEGFFLNGQSVKLKGTCNHQDHAGVGSALPDRLHEYRIGKLKAMGSNAYRTAHNPPSPELLDACDRLGMLVIDETRMMSSDEEGISQLSRMIRRDRNHPSIILWSIGNEEHELQGSERGAQVAADMKRVVRELDPTRPITAAVDQPEAWGIGITPVLDVLGCNYRTDGIPAFHARDPLKPVIGTETGSTVCTRGIYARDDARGFVPAYDIDFPWWASTAQSWWNVVAPNPFIAGGFVWTGFDYRGEPTPFNRWPNVASQFGIMDSCGFPKDNWFYYRAQWSDEPLLHLFPHWNWRAGETVAVWCHSNLDSVELFLNGASLGAQSVPRYGHVQWQVPYAPGVIEARGMKGGKQILLARRETAGPAAAVVLTPDRASIRADGEDVSVVRVEIVDAQGRGVPDAGHEVSFALSGPGAIIGVGNGDPTSHEPDKASRRRAFNGLCMAIVQASKTPGAVRLSASAPGLQSGSVTIDAAAATARLAL